MAAIKSATGVEAELIESGGGVFEVEVDGKRIFSKKAEEAIPNLLDRIGRIESDGRLDEHTRYLCEFLRRSTHQGVYGRYRESLRTDSSDDRREFYAQGEDETDPVRSGDKP